MGGCRSNQGGQAAVRAAPAPPTRPGPPPYARTSTESRGRPFAELHATPKIATMRNMVVSEMNESRTNDQLQGAHEPCASTPDNGRSETLVRVGRREFPIPLQERGWVVPAALRGDAIAELWRIIRSRRIKSDVKIRAIEALVRLDNQALQERRHDVWRDVQSANHGRSNVRVLAELARQRSLPTNPPRPGKDEPKS